MREQTTDSKTHCFTEIRLNSFQGKQKMLLLFLPKSMSVLNMATCNRMHSSCDCLILRHHVSEDTLFGVLFHIFLKTVVYNLVGYLATIVGWSNKYIETSLLAREIYYTFFLITQCQYLTFSSIFNLFYHYFSNSKIQQFNLNKIYLRCFLKCKLFR